MAPGTVKIVRSLRNGQMTIPSEFRKRLGITDDSLLQVRVQGEELRVRPVQTSVSGVEQPGWLQALYDDFADVRAEAADMSESEINDAIDQALKEVRAGAPDA